MGAGMGGLPIHHVDPAASAGARSTLSVASVGVVLRIAKIVVIKGWS